MKLNDNAETGLRSGGVTQAERARANGFADGRWRGDACGCPDDRCTGFHHGEGHECGCLLMLAQYLNGEGFFAGSAR